MQGDRSAAWAWGADGVGHPLGAVAVSGQAYYALAVTGTISGSVDAWSQGQNIANSAVTVGASQASLVAADTTRRAITIVNNHASNTLYVGATGLTTATGCPILPSASATFSSSAPAAWFGIASGAGTDVRILQEKN
jgi:hypothetical protein